MAWWFGRSKRPEAKKEPPAAEDIVARVHGFLSDDDRQNRKLPEWLREEIGRAPSVDQVPGGTGEFGRDPGNPIPANGPFGEAQYLSWLMTDAGQPIAFQRLGSTGRVDVFETVGFDGRDWDVLYLTRYFPRKSQIAPKGFRFATKDERPALIRGVVDQAEDFPFATFARVAKFTTRVLGVSIADPRLKAFDTLKYRIPEEHVRQLEQLRFGVRAATGEEAR